MWFSRAGEVWRGTDGHDPVRLSKAGTARYGKFGFGEVGQVRCEVARRGLVGHSR